MATKAQDLALAASNVDSTGAVNATTVDSLDSSQFVRSDTNDSITGNLTVNGGITANTLQGSLTGNVAGDMELPAINKSIADTAIDVFVYDTSKDSDGGAWRKRTQHTSWYNETLNTATRGARKEFPAVAVIVAENGTVTIYDGDDPDLPMWMVFTSDTWQGGVPTRASATTGTTTAVSMLNGLFLISSTGSSAAGLATANFVSDTTEFISGLGFNYTFNKSIIKNRNVNVTASATGGLPSYGLVSFALNDIAMTVLPNAPIDPATQLPIPTIAVATDGGVSVIKDDGTVVDATSYGVAPLHISINEEGRIIGGGVWNQELVIYDIPLTDGTYADAPNSVRYRSVSIPPVYSSASRASSTFANGNIVSNPAGNGFDIVSPELNSVAWIKNNYNTGWMNGDIKLATLSDTDATNVTGSELVTNGTFDSDTNGWSFTDGSESVVNGVLEITNTSGVWGVQTVQYVPTEAGKTYSVSYYVPTDSAASYVYCLGNRNVGQKGQLGFTFTATSTSTAFVYKTNTNTVGSVIKLDNVSVRLAEEDRSVNGNGLQVFGTVTKTAVNTGNDLVAYSGFSNSNYLQQPYNSALNFGTGDFCVMGWIKSNGGSWKNILTRQSLSGAVNFGDGRTLQFQQADGGYLCFRSYISGGGADSNEIIGSVSINNNTWKHVCAVRSNGVISLYVDGKFDVSSSSYSGVNMDNSTGVVNVGTTYYNGSYLTGYTVENLALLRVSATAPTAEQIAKIYEDEKVLFQEGAQATLYGSSDAVTALAYDDTTDLLHVGTSSGRSTFSGLKRVDNTTTGVTTAISASNEMIVEQ